jgi:hypothetical protein
LLFLPTHAPDGHAGAANHWFDTLVGCVAAASMAGANPLTKIAGLPKRKKMSLRALQEQMRQCVTYF